MEAIAIPDAVVSTAFASACAKDWPAKLPVTEPVPALFPAAGRG